MSTTFDTHRRSQHGMSLYRELPLGKSCKAIFTRQELTALSLRPDWDDATLLQVLYHYPDVFQRGIARGKAFRRAQRHRHREAEHHPQR